MWFHHSSCGKVKNLHAKQSLFASNVAPKNCGGARRSLSFGVTSYHRYFSLSESTIHFVLQLVYKAEVTRRNVNPARVYFGATEPTFKTRYGNHKDTFNHEQRRKSTELSKYVWKMTERQEDYSIQWSISERAQAYSYISKRCQLCLSEKFRS